MTFPPGPDVPVPTESSMFPAVPPIASPVIILTNPLGPASDKPVFNWIPPLTPDIPAFAVSTKILPLERLLLTPDCTKTEPPVPPLESPPFKVILPPVSVVLSPLAAPPAMLTSPPFPPSDSLGFSPAPAEICTLPPFDSLALVLPAFNKTSPPETFSESLEG